ncbi:Pentatricopeptide repeat [Macleaya cordata]|uniref:Pentatricopeptide repeat n=1 Tax=Macleaya cordata TaxID=56857 RepID=A0A200Q2H0_MACCD|nr:Pentatricopeptide repeat [Macleaya cordata]
MQKGFLPNSYTFPPLMKSCKKMIGSSQKATGQKCHGQAIKNYVVDVLPVQNSLIHMYASFGLIDSAWRVFDGMSTRDLVTWHSIVDGYVKLGELVVAHRIFDKMPIRNVVSWNIMITGYLNAGNPGCGLKLFREMVKTGLKEDEKTVALMLSACGQSARLKEGRSVHGSLMKNFLKSNLIVDTALIDMYSKCKRVESAKRVFDSMVKKNLVCWNTMILGHCLHGCPEDGINLFEEMVRRGDSKGGMLCGHNKSKIRRDEEHVILPDEVTFIGVLCACARSGSLSKGRAYFNQMVNVYCIKPTFAHYWCMANLYAGAGLLQEAEKILMSMSMPDGDEEEEEEEKEDRWLSDDSMLWGSLLGLCRFRGDVDLGEKIAMRLIELEPHNSSWYMLLLNIYAAAGRWEEALKVKELTKERGVSRKPSCSLFDLNKIVHDFKLGENSNQPGMIQVYAMVDELARRLSLPKRGTGTSTRSYCLTERPDTSSERYQK